MAADPVARFEEGLRSWFRLRGAGLSAPALVGFSGGPDSTALLAGLRAVGAGPLLALHLDHGLRPRKEREAERELVRSNARRLGVEFLGLSLAEGEVAGLANSEGIGLEAAARRLRLSLLLAEAGRRGLSRIYLGHTRDDEIEGLLMRFFAGSGSTGLRGIRPVAGLLWRPLLGLGRAEVLAYLEARGLEASFDSSNADTSLLRNRVRARLLPLLDADFPGWRQGLLRSARRLAEEDEALQTLATGALGAEAAAASEGGEGSLELGAFASLPWALRFRALASLLSRELPRLGLPPFPGGRLPSRMLEAALAALEEGRRFEGHGFLLLAEEGRLKVLRSLDFEKGAGYFVALNESDIGRSRVLPTGVGIELAWSGGPGDPGIPEGSFDFPLIVRSRRAGDFIAAAPGGKAVDRLFSDWGLSPGDRARVPLVQDRRGLLAVLASPYRGGRDIFRAQGSPRDPGRRLLFRLKGA